LSSNSENIDSIRIKQKKAAFGWPFFALTAFQKAGKEKFEFPYLLIGSQELVKQFKAQKTPHAYVIRKVQGKWQITYDGDIDYIGANPHRVKRSI